MSDISKRIANLPPEKRALLELRLKQKELSIKNLTSISKRKSSDVLLLSLVQERLWFLYQLQPDIPLFNDSILIHVTGKLDSIALEKSFNEIIKRHEILRTTFKIVDTQPIQIIAPTITLKLLILDLQELSKPEQEELVKQIITEQSSKTFDLTQELLLRCKLIKLKQQEHIILLTMHHIICDGLSRQIFYRELGTLYQAFCDGTAPALPELPIQYADFALWQRQSLDDETYKSQLVYWQQKLENLPPVFALPKDNPRPAVQSLRGARQTLILPQSLTEALKSLSQKEGVTLFMVLLAAFKTLLYRYTGQTDLVVGTPIANRNQIETENLLGCFINTLVLRTDLSNNPSFRELLARVRETTLAAYAHQDLPFEQLVKELQPERTLSHNPLFQTMFVFQDSPLQTLELPGLKLTPSIVDSGFAEFDLTLFLEDTKLGLMGALEYSTDLFRADTINRIIGHWQTLLAGIVSHPDENISKLALLTKFEENQLLVDWNQTTTDYTKDQCIHQLFAAQVERTPNAVAVVFADQQLTYRELNEKANQLAHYLQKLGVQPEVPVGICVERSLEMAIAILAILKAGGAYVPIDPNYPQERIAYILANSQALVLLTQEKLIKELPEHQACLVCLDTDWQAISQESRSNPFSNTGSENLAYVIYTSGSTGTPKGVLITHKSLVNFTEAAVVEYGLTQGDRVLQFASISFDAAAEEIYPCLTCGGTLVLRTDEMLSDGQTFLQKCQDLKLTVLDLPTAYWQQLMSDIATADLRLPDSLRLVIIGGEQAQGKQVEIWRNCVGDRQELINTYGPTEATVVATTYKLPLAPTDNPSLKIPIGRPIPNAQTYVLDKYLQPVPIGVVGELYISGVGIARGYLNRPDLTADKFIPHPFSNQLGARLYKTGDLVRYRQDGNIEFLGRIDNQVKVRGFRIELGEIESVLSQHPAVREVVVLAREEKAGNKRLVAYIVPNKQSRGQEDLIAGSDRLQSETLEQETQDLDNSNIHHSALSHDLRNFVKEKLPEYMIPAAFVFLEVMPLTPNGKVNLQALPAPEQQTPQIASAFIAPETTVEKQLATIWAQVLGREKVGIKDNFFALGGDSILSLQVVSKAREAGLQLTPKQIFQYQTIAELVAVVSTTETIIAAEQGIVTGTVPLTPIQHWFFAQNLHFPHHYNQAVLLAPKQPLDITCLEKAVQALLQHHDALRLRFVKGESGWQQVNADVDGVVPLVQRDFSALPETQQKQVIADAANELQASLNLSEGPLLRFALFHLGRNQQRLLIVIHHLAVDGVSWRILLQDLQRSYEQICCSQRIQLASKTTSFKQWAEQLQAYAQADAFKQELNYWQQELQQPIASLPVDFPGGENTMAKAEIVSVALSPEETQALLQEVPQAYNTQINDVLLTALAQTFAQWQGIDCLLVDLEAHGREAFSESIDLSRTVGWFTAVFPVVLKISPDSHPGEALKAVKEQLRRIPNQGMGYGIWRYLRGDEVAQALQALPQAEVAFNYLGQFDQSLSSSSLFQFAPESSGRVYSPQETLPYLLEINGMVSAGQLRLEWSFSQEIYQSTTVEKLAVGYIDALRSLITHCQSADAGGFTPSDFAEFQQSQWNQADLDAITAVIREM
ncbi:non-ribosomal peptide synthetase [Fischerella thermalis CCMEE 5330]|uniref:Non-ribosomal peptide synthetase n=1 Tax=Fischerella thermalis CCMEE 5330 TaxID=2019670 RepID=A0A2N6M8Z2_9CYAN|nr:non-ribosomal peptide synthetase [Fischerella thermalis]PMB43198.1 non-ribosomal peptide synthetase [Fischerella thermalis CCMEE 5330]